MVPVLRFFLNKSFIIDLLILLLSGLTFFVFVPFFHVSVDPKEFIFLDGSIFLKTSLSFMLLFVILVLNIFIILHLIKLKKVSRCLSIFLLSWIVFAGFVFPTVQSNGMIEASETFIDNKNIILVLSLSLICSLMVLTKFKLAPVIFCIIIIAISLVQSLPVFLGACKKTENPTGCIEVSTERNIFVISFDGIPSIVVRNILADNSELSDVFKDFVFFPNAVSQAPATHASIRSELYGNRNYHAIALSNKDVDSLLHPNILLINNVKDSFTYGSYNSYNLNNRNKIEPLSFSFTTEQEKTSYHLYWIALLSARIGTPELPRILKEMGIYDFIMNWVASSNGADMAYSSKLYNYVGPAWKKSYIRHIQDYYWIVDNLVATKNELSIRYMHFLHSHYPVDFDEQNIFRSDDPVWYKDNQNYRGLYNQCVGVLLQFKTLIDKLKELDIYNKSLIVFKGDHGKPAIYYDFFPNDLRINGNELWGIDRYMPLLMIKDYSCNKDHITYNSDLVTIGDLAKTLCISAQIAGQDCSIFPGLNLLGPYKLSDSPKFYVETVTGPRSTFQFDTHQTIPLERSARSFHEILELSGKVELHSCSQSIRDRSLGTSEPIFFTMDGKVSDFIRFGWSNQEPNHRWTVGSQAKLIFKLKNQSEKDLLLRLKAFAYLGGGLSHQTIDVIVNHKKVGTWQMRGLGWYEAVIPSGLLPEDGLFEVIFDISDPTSPLEVGESADSRKLGIAAQELLFLEKENKRSN